MLFYHFGTKNVPLGIMKISGRNVFYIRSSSGRLYLISVYDLCFENDTILVPKKSLSFANLVVLEVLYFEEPDYFFDK